MELVKIHIRTHMKEQNQILEQNCSGKLFPKGEGWYLVYKEELGENQLVSTTMNLSGEKVTIIRTGAIRMRQEYIVGKWTEGKYEGPFGHMWMETRTESIEVSQYRVSMRYQLKLNGDHLGHYAVDMKMEGIS